MNTKYQDIDEKIIAAIRGGRTVFVQIHCCVDAPFRLVDRRLQALRKRGVLTYSRKLGWTSK